MRVVDLTAWWAGPGATQLLACLGADVVKVESTVRPDQIRFAGPKAPGDPQWWEWGPLFHAVNTNKRGLTLDLSRPEGLEVALALLARADLAFENFTPRVMASSAWSGTACRRSIHVSAWCACPPSDSTAPGAIGRGLPRPWRR